MLIGLAQRKIKGKWNGPQGGLGQNEGITKIGCQNAFRI
jgi:hypothetical protein